MQAIFRSLIEMATKVRKSQVRVKKSKELSNLLLQQSQIQLPAIQALLQERSQRLLVKSHISTRLTTLDPRQLRRALDRAGLKKCPRLTA